MIKKIFNFLKTLVFGIIPAVIGAGLASSAALFIRNVKAINVGSGWWVVLCFVLAMAEFTLCIMLLYELGKIQVNSKKWIAHKKTMDADNISGIVVNYTLFFWLC